MYNICQFLWYRLQALLVSSNQKKVLKSQLWAGLYRNWLQRTSLSCLQHVLVGNSPRSYLSNAVSGNNMPLKPGTHRGPGFETGSLCGYRSYPKNVVGFDLYENCGVSLFFMAAARPGSDQPGNQLRNVGNDDNIGQRWFPEICQGPRWCHFLVMFPERLSDSLSGVHYWRCPLWPHCLPCYWSWIYS